MAMPHYMFYAPKVTNADIGGKFNSEFPFILGLDCARTGPICVMQFTLVRIRVPRMTRPRTMQTQRANVLAPIKCSVADSKVPEPEGLSIFRRTATQKSLLGKHSGATFGVPGGQRSNLPRESNG